MCKEKSTRPVHCSAKEHGMCGIAASLLFASYHVYCLHFIFQLNLSLKDNFRFYVSEHFNPLVLSLELMGNTLLAQNLTTANKCCTNSYLLEGKE